MPAAIVVQSIYLLALMLSMMRKGRTQRDIVIWPFIFYLHLSLGGDKRSCSYFSSLYFQKRVFISFTARFCTNATRVIFLTIKFHTFREEKAEFYFHEFSRSLNSKSKSKTHCNVWPSSAPHHFMVLPLVRFSIYMLFFGADIQHGDQLSPGNQRDGEDMTDH